MKRAALRFVAGFITILAIPSACIGQTDLDSKRQALEIIGQAADRLCGTVGTTGTVGTAEGSAEAKAEVDNVLKKFADIGIRAEGRVEGSQYEGLLQKDLAAALKDNADCKLRVFNALNDKLLGGPTVAASPKPPADSDDAITSRVRQLVANWCAAYFKGDATTFVRLAREPFYFGHMLVLTKPELEQVFAEMWKSQGSTLARVTVEDIEVSRLRDLKQPLRTKPSAHKYRPANLSPDDFAAQVKTQLEGREKYIAVFVRSTATALQVVATWD